MKSDPPLTGTTHPNAPTARPGIACAEMLLSLLLLLTLPAVAQAQYTFSYGGFNYTTNNGTITITGYTGPGGSVVIPPALPVNDIYPLVTAIGYQAFYGNNNMTSVTIPDTVFTIVGSAFAGCSKLTSVSIGNAVLSIGTGAFASDTSLLSATIPDSVLSIGNSAFAGCSSLATLKIGRGVISMGTSYAFAQCGKLTNVTIADGVTTIGDQAFWADTSLTSITIPNSVTNLGYGAFDSCTSLTRVTIGTGVTSIGDSAFNSCSSLTSVLFMGNAPSPVGVDVFYPDNSSTIYYLPGTTGWTNPWQTRPAVLWNPLVQVGNGTFGVRTNRFGFTITGSSNLVVVVEATTNLANPLWSPLHTNTLVGGSSYFSDPQWTNYACRFYRFGLP